MRLKLIHRHHVGARAGVLNELGHAPAPIEVSERRHHGLPFGLRAGEAHGIRQLVIRNIDCRFHEAILVPSGFLTKWLTKPDAVLKGCPTPQTTVTSWSVQAPLWVPAE